MVSMKTLGGELIQGLFVIGGGSNGEAKQECNDKSIL